MRLQPIEQLANLLSAVPGSKRQLQHDPRLLRVQVRSTDPPAAERARDESVHGPGAEDHRHVGSVENLSGGFGRLRRDTAGADACENYPLGAGVNGGLDQSRVLV